MRETRSSRVWIAPIATIRRKIGGFDDRAAFQPIIAAHQLRPQRLFVLADEIRLPERRVGEPQPILGVIEGNEHRRILRHRIELLENLVGI